MRRFIFAVFLTALLFSQSFSQERIRCGTLTIAENRSKLSKLALPANCEVYTGVKDKTTEHFQIFYIETGEHGIGENINPGYIDSLAIYLEEAYDFHKNTLGMKNILGAEKTQHFNQSVNKNLYPIEILDLCKMCRHQICDAVGAVFTPDGTSPMYAKPPTQIVIENYLSSSRLKWHEFLKIIVYHELYHSFQLTQYKLGKQGENSFWLEASATGIEDISIPEANDYISYFSSNNYQLPRYFKTQGKSMEDTKVDDGYAHASLYLFLIDKFGKKFDSEIWEKFSKDENKKKSFSEHLHELLTEKGFNPEDLFHEYAEAMYFSGTNASKPNAPEPFSNDMRQWPEWRIFANNNLKTLPAGAIDFVMTAPNETPKVDSAKFSEIDRDGSNSIWALSRLLNLVKEDTEFAAYPNPWNPSANAKRVRFKGLGENYKGVEIRAANGALIDRIYGDFWEPKKNIAPGILYYRKLPYGKNKILIVRY